MAETVQDIIERIEQARDRYQNASDDEGVRFANQALVDLRSLVPTAVTVGRDIEQYFQERTSRRAGAGKSGNADTKPNAGARKALMGDDLSDDS